MGFGRGFFNRKFEDMVKNSKSASYYICNFQLTILCCIYKNNQISSKPKQKLSEYASMRG